MSKSAYAYNTQYEILIGRYGTSSEANLIGNLYNVENGMWANEKSSAYLKRIRPELITIVNNLDVDSIGPTVKKELLLSAETASDYQSVCSLLDKVDFLTHDSEK